MSLKIKLTSAIIMFILILSTLVIGVIAAESQTIKLYGNVTFNVNDTSLFVKSVSIRQSETDDYVLLDDFLPGYVDENMNINLGPHEISYSSFSLRFDVINRTAETYVPNSVTLPTSLSSQGVSASASGTINPTTKPLGSNNMADISITDDPDGQIIVTVTSTIAQTINLEGITVSIILQLEVLEGYSFSGNTLTGYTGSETEITIPSSYSIFNGQYVEGDDYQVTTIDTTGFTNRANITSITLPSTVTNIGSGVTFDNWTSLSAINVDPGNTTYSSENGVLYNADKSTLIRYPEGKTDSTYQIPTTVATIGAYSFDSTKITSISIPTSVTLIQENAFANSKQLQQLIFAEAESAEENGLTIGPAFVGCTMLNELIMPRRTIKIADNIIMGSFIIKMNIPYYICYKEYMMSAPGEDLVNILQCASLLESIASASGAILESTLIIESTYFAWCLDNATEEQLSYWGGAGSPIPAVILIPTTLASQILPGFEGSGISQSYSNQGAVDGYVRFEKIT